MSRKCIWLVVLAVGIAWFAGLAQGQTVYINFQSTSQGESMRQRRRIPQTNHCLHRAP